MFSDRSRVVTHVRAWNCLAVLAVTMLWAGSAAAQSAGVSAARPGNQPQPRDAASNKAADALINELRPAEPSATGVADSVAGDVGDNAPADGDRQVRQAREEVLKLRAELKAAQRRVAELERALAQQQHALGVRTTPVAPSAQRAPADTVADRVVSVFVAPNADPRIAGNNVVIAPANKDGAVVVRRPDGATITASRIVVTNREDRLEMLERQVQEMLAEVRSLRNEAKSGRPGRADRFQETTPGQSF